MYSTRETITLLNGLVLQNNDGFPPLQEVAPEVKHACEVCPVRICCQDNNEFDCQVYGMFDGFGFNFDDVLEMLEKYTLVMKR